MAQKVIYMNNLAHLIEVNGGWSKIGLEDGTEKKVRNNTLQPYVEPVKAEGVKKEPKPKDTGDIVANWLRPLDLPGAYALAAKKMSTTVKDLTARYGHLNPGQQRMNLGNRLRGYLKNGK